MSSRGIPRDLYSSTLIRPVIGLGLLVVSFGNGLFCALHPLVLEALEAYASAQSSSPGHGAQNRVPGLGKPLSHPGSTHCIWALPLEIRPTSHK